MTQTALAWSEPRPTGWASVEAVDGDGEWRIVPVPRDVARIHYAGRDADGTVVSSGMHCAHAETRQEAEIVVAAMRMDQAALPDWRTQLELAGLVRTYPDADDTLLSGMWHDARQRGRYGIVISDRRIHGDGSVETSVDATYESSRSTFWHNVCRIDAHGDDPRTIRGTPYRGGLPQGVDALKAGVFAAIAIRDARIARGGRFATPLGGSTKERPKG